MTVRAGRRTILHVDMDAFFVSVELRRRPELRGQPVVVGGTGARGVVAAASYEARRYGVHSAMPSARARRLCPAAVFLPGDHALYEQVSRQVHEIFGAFTPIIEPISLDEAFLDVTGAQRLLGDGRAIGRTIRARVLDELELACSVGVAPTKLLAKLASEAAKPSSTPAGVRPGHEVYVVELGTELTFLHAHPVQALWGVGPATLARLQRLGIATIGDLAALPEATLVGALGKASGAHLHRLANGIDERPVQPDRELKSVGHEQTFATDLFDLAELDVELVRMADAVATRLRAQRVAARTINLKVRFSTFATITRAQTAPIPVDTGPGIVAVARALLAQVDRSLGVRLLGVSASNLVEDAPRQLSLAVASPGPSSSSGSGPPDGPAAVSGEWIEASGAIDEIRERFGAAAIGPASLVAGPGAIGPGLRLTRRGQQQWGPDHPDGDSA
jgi:DNA polymerase-4